MFRKFISTVSFSILVFILAILFPTVWLAMFTISIVLPNSPSHIPNYLCIICPFALIFPLLAWISSDFRLSNSSFICKINGRHDFIDWKFMSNDSCTQIRICKRDNYQEKRIMHEWGKWEYTTDDSCAQVRTCKKDNYQEERILHQWGKWEYQSDGNERFCLRCKARDHVETSQPESSNSCPLCGASGYSDKFGCGQCGHFPGDDRAGYAR